jgi:outer membrane protein assembly factor BamB
MPLSRAVLPIVLAFAGTVAAADWPQWRGPSRDGVAAVPAPRTWPAALTRAWSVPVGLGHAAPVVVGARVFSFAREGEDEVLRALDLGTGREVWRQSYPAPYRMNSAAAGHGPGPKSTPVVAEGRVFTLGISGILSAHDAGSGLLLWRKHPGQFPSPAPKFGAAQSPVVDRGRVIVHWGGGEGGALAAFDAATGVLRWQWTDDLPAYASPVVADIGGVRQVVTLTETRLVGLDADAGRLLWSVPITTSYEQNSVTPLVIGDRVVFSGLDHPLRAVRIARIGAGWQALPAWENEDVPLYMSTPVAAGGRLFGFSHRRKGQLFAVDAATGATVWTSDGRQGENASLVATGSVVLALLDTGEIVAFDAAAGTFQPLHRSTVASSATWAHVALVEGGLLVKDVNTLSHLRY